ncbi:glycosyltransferase [Pelagicoccus sp. SDUM812002]|uniref:glycosyltransferase n=1 Tax=Pelagicoccus sp. SDUM812002 TaxID=3041266 RepID=UPI00280F8032|nr:glycosyltransferase [Pelagicoccus sp. SDUM812002]MDQ8187399.1 glycosyltransferase [Pelagicoccus sp. SDUM812002]
MKIAMFTNTYLPHVGGVARSVSSFANAYRELGHQCLVISPEFEEKIPDEQDVYRVPAITNFNDSGFSFQLPFVGNVAGQLDEFEPDIIHSHHPFLLGDTALRAAYTRDIPIVFTHHTLYEEYTNYLPFDSDFTKKAAMELATGFANACSMVLAPSSSLEKLILDRGVHIPVKVQPTGIDVDAFAKGRGETFRKTYDIPENAPLVGHVGRIAKEKNLPFLAEAVSSALEAVPEAYFALVGTGEEDEHIHELLSSKGLGKRFVATGSLQGTDLADAYASFDLFAFASQSETQGLVLAEAMAGNSPVIALSGPGVTDVLEHEKNGILLAEDASKEEYSKALTTLLREPEKLETYSRAAREKADQFSILRTAESALEHYRECIENHASWIEGTGIENFDRVIAALEGELQLLKVKTATVSTAIIN